MSSKPVALILGAGPRVGTSVARKFVADNYDVAIVSRTGIGLDGNVYSLAADLANPDSIPVIFEQVKAKFDAAPSVIIYNAAALTPPLSPDSLFSIPADSFQSDLKVNTISPYVAAQQAVKGWETLPEHTRKTFIYTGNAQNAFVLPVPLMLNLGVGKSASAYWIGVADASYSLQGYRFFYADERTAEGMLKGQALDGPAHAEFYTHLTTHADIPWHATFVKDKGYVKF